MLKIALESLGCSKNLVDAEIMMGILNKKGYKLTGDFEEADVILVNTCGFIESAKQESIDTIIEFANLKETGNLKLLIVTGCLAQRYSDELKQEIPEIDAIVGTGSYQNIDEILEGLQKEKQIVSLKDIEVVYNEDLPRYVSTPEYMAYLKISEGCDKHCTYCIIPKLRGKQKSRKIEDIVAEVELNAIYKGKVTRIVNFGAFVELLPGKEGLLRIGNIAHERIEKVEDVLNVGDEVEVKVTEIDEKGRVNVSRKVLLPKPERKHK